MNEFGIIKKYFAPLAKAKGALSLTDDAALISVPKGMELAVTKDAIVEGVHFIGNESPALIAGKLLGTNLSDLAAMGAIPHGYFLALMLPENTKEGWIKSFAQGLKVYQKAWGISLMGGDTTHTKDMLCLSLTALGFVPKGKALKRSGAKIGDDIYVSGTIGDAALGLQVAQGKMENDFLLRRYRLPSPRITLGQALRGIATSCIDISDGLLQDMRHITECSGVGAVIKWDDNPLSLPAKKMLPLIKNPREIIAAGGDDYELLFTAPRGAREKLQAVARKACVKVTCIGNITREKAVKMIDKDGKNINVARMGYTHFKEKP